MRLTVVNMKQHSILNDTYRIIEQIGAGGGGIVYRAEHLRLNIDVVVKQIRDEIKGKIDIRQEADVLKRIKHPYLPRIYDFIETEDGIYTVMDYIPGQSLEDVLQARRISADTIMKWAGQLAEALAYLHSQNPPIIHSDIKPGNIIITPEENVCLIDFNIAITLDQSLKSSVGVSVCYSPPEQYGDFATYKKITNYVQSQRIEQNIAASSQSTVTLDLNEFQNVDASNRQVWTRRQIDTRSDIYSMGCVLYHMITGYAPNISFEEILPVSQAEGNVSEGLKVIVEKMMQFEATERYFDGREFLEALRNCHKLDRKYILYKRKQRRYLLFSIGLLVIGAAFMGTGVSQIREERRENYRQAMVMADSLVETEKYDEASEILLQIQKSYKNEPLAYEKELHYYYLQEDYEKCLQRSNEILTLSMWDDEKNKESLANIYYIVANAFYEKGQYSEAVSAIENAIFIKEDDVIYCRDYCVFLAKNGEPDKAEKEMEKLEKLGATQDALCLIRGEICAMEGEYEEAVDTLKKAVLLTPDETLKKRAIYLCANAMKYIQDIDGSVAWLQEMQSKFGVTESLMIREQMATLYLEKANASEQKEIYWRKALDLYSEIKRDGKNLYQIDENIAILQENLGDVDAAEKTLKEMEINYPYNYRVYKRLAILEADKQQRVDNEKRDYKDMLEYYAQAKNLYEDEKIEDAEMYYLESLMSDLKTGGWIE